MPETWARGRCFRSLRSVAPVTAVAGNLDTDALSGRLPSEAAGVVRSIHFVVGHKRKKLMKRLAAGKLGYGPDATPPQLVVFGHEHLPSASWVEGTLFLNPGSATSPYEEDETPTVAIVEAADNGLSVTFVPLPRRENRS